MYKNITKVLVKTTPEAFKVSRAYFYFYILFVPFSTLLWHLLCLGFPACSQAVVTPNSCVVVAPTPLCDDVAGLSHARCHAKHTQAYP